ncbi:hypothetical protein M427DRAFT_390927 [Gonapodya prolifera JEL478]|uniref:Uncharacterized protein n=1 Tax=Gonapodya prolifera (strain JEL478) TaxID=1344416 RepID=A0A139A7P6_GONPJ|nr:hypothetical protein M427DRAFT_390927 [Gonapodya prolifera JEL478]|eukprot:KXS12698.1 hypothetical protein M427DRAFT_390927 [Gonapodya prolifera JEL478]
MSTSTSRPSCGPNLEPAEAATLRFCILSETWETGTGNTGGELRRQRRARISIRAAYSIYLARFPFLLVIWALKFCRRLIDLQHASNYGEVHCIIQITVTVPSTLCATISLFVKEGDTSTTLNNYSLGRPCMCQPVMPGAVATVFPLEYAIYANGTASFKTCTTDMILRCYC